MRSASLLVKPGDPPVNHADATGWGSPRSDADDLRIRTHLASVSQFPLELAASAESLNRPPPEAGPIQLIGARGTAAPPTHASAALHKTHLCGQMKGESFDPGFSLWSHASDLQRAGGLAFKAGGWKTFAHRTLLARLAGSGLLLRSAHGRKALYAERQWNICIRADQPFDRREACCQSAY